MKLARTNIRIFCDLFPEYSNIWIFVYDNSACQNCSYWDPEHFSSDSDDDDEEVFDHYVNNEDSDTESEEEDDEYDIYL